jgi:competence protein ComEA
MKQQRVIIIILAVLVCVPVIVKSRVSVIKSPPAAFSVSSSGKIIVRVTGDVRHPGIYEVYANTLADSVINMAVVGSSVKVIKPDEKGAHPVVNGADLHLKAQHDGTGVITVGSMPAAARMVLGVPLDINSMDETDFDRLPGVGPVMARCIIEYRQKNGGKMRMEDLQAVEGVGKVMYQRLNKYF